MRSLLQPVTLTPKTKKPCWKRHSFKAHPSPPHPRFITHIPSYRNITYVPKNPPSLLPDKPTPRQKCTVGSDILTGTKPPPHSPSVLPPEGHHTPSVLSKRHTPKQSCSFGSDILIGTKPLFVPPIPRCITPIPYYRNATHLNKAAALVATN